MRGTPYHFQVSADSKLTRSLFPLAPRMLTCFLAEEFFGGFGLRTPPITRSKAGEPLSSYFGYVIDGIFRNETQVEAHADFLDYYDLDIIIDGGGNQGNGLAWPYNNGPGGCCGFYQPSHNPVNAFKTDEQGLPLIDTYADDYFLGDEGLSSDDPYTPYAGNLDPRLDWTVGRRGVPYLDWGIHAGRSWVRDQAYAGPYSPKKHIASEAESSTVGWANLHANIYRSDCIRAFPKKQYATHRSTATAIRRRTLP